VGYKGLTAVPLKIQVFWNITPYQLLHPAKVKAWHSFVTSVTTRIYQCTVYCHIRCNMKTSNLAIMMNSHPISFPMPCLQNNVPVAVLRYSLAALGFKCRQAKETFLSLQMSSQGQILSAFM